MNFVRMIRSIAAIAIVSAMMLTISSSAAATTIQDFDFRNAIEASYDAWNSHKPEALAKFYAKDPDLIFYDALPMQYTGWADYQAGIQKNLFDNMPKFKLTTNDDVRVTRKGDLAWTTFTWHLSAQLKDGTPIETDGRQTDIWEKRNGQWEIVHEHISAPVSTEA